MLKRILVLLIICSTIICGTACDKAPYDIITKDGKHYISSNLSTQNKQAESDELYASIVNAIGIYFTDVGQMKMRIKNCDFNDQELAAIQYNCRGDGLWEICDLNNLCDAKTPQDVAVEGVYWYGNSYSFKLDYQLASGCSFSCPDPETYNYSFQEYYADCPRSLELAREFWDEKISDRNATQTFYQTDAGDFKLIKYEIREKNRTLYVAENYCLASYERYLEASDSVPQFINVFIEENGTLCSIRISEPEDRPSVEWLSSFGVTPYEG